jgi:hypothetical protein
VKQGSNTQKNTTFRYHIQSSKGAKFASKMVSST